MSQDPPLHVKPNWFTSRVVEKPLVIEAYRQVKRYFDTLLNPADHAVFRIERL